MPLLAACNAGSYEEAVENSIRAGGCSVSRATLAGALAAAAGGTVPAAWRSLAPCAARVEELAAELAKLRGD